MTEKDLEFLPYPNEKGGFYYDRESIYSKGELKDFTYRQTEHEIMTDRKIEDYEKRRLQNMEVLKDLLEEFENEGR